MASNLYEVDDGTLRLFFHQGQQRAWDSYRRFIFILAGTQGGKTSFGPWWLWREIYDSESGKGAGDYLAVTASYDLFKLKMLPEMRRVFEDVMNVGRYWAGDQVIELADPKTRKFGARNASDANNMWGRIILRSASAQGGLESATAKAAWLDECGQDEFTLETWEAVRRRLSLSQGRVLGTTTLYNRGWLKSKVYDSWHAGHGDYQVIQFPSYVNPSFPREEFDSATEDMQSWKVNMFYLGEFDRPAGMIYDCFDETTHCIPRFAIPDHWRRYVGMDFGGVNTAAVFFAEERVPDPERPGQLMSRFYGYQEYKAGQRTAAEHKESMLEEEEQIPTVVGGAKSEGQWRDEFAAAGLPVREPEISDVEVGIDRVYGALKRGQVFFFDDLDGVIDEFGTYSRELDDMGEPTEKIKNKNAFHFLDAIRYIFTHIGGKRVDQVQVRRQAVNLYGSRERTDRRDRRGMRGRR